MLLEQKSTLFSDESLSDPPPKMSKVLVSGLVSVIQNFFGEKPNITAGNDSNELKVVGVVTNGETICRHLSGTVTQSFFHGSRVF